MLKAYQPGEIITAYRETVASSYLYYSVRLEDGTTGYIIYPSTQSKLGTLVPRLIDTGMISSTYQRVN